MKQLNMGNLNVAEQYPSAQTFMNGGQIQKQVSYPHVGAGLAQEPTMSYGAQKNPLQVSLFKLIQILREFINLNLTDFCFYRIWQLNRRTQSDLAMHRNLLDFLALSNQVMELRKTFVKS